MNEPVRVALIGCGRIAQVAHLPALEKAEGFQ
jgi:predicted dehydrogenase